MRTCDARKFFYARSPALCSRNPELDDPGSGCLARLAGVGLKPIDRHRAKEPLAIAANNAFVRARVEQAWRRDVVAIRSPVDVQRILDGRGDCCERLTDETAGIVAGLPAEFVLGAAGGP